MKKISKLLILILLSLLIVSTISSISYVYGTSTDDAIKAMTDMGKSEITDDSGGKLGKMINSVIGFIQVVGTGISMIMVTILGIKYIMAAPSDKADVKKQIAPMVIGAILLFGAVNLVNIVANIAMSSLEKAGGSSDGDPV